MSKRTYMIFSLLLTLLLTSIPVFGQATTVTVPDLTGLTLPKAGALLNRNGLALGAQSFARWTDAAGQPEGTISGQSVDAGQSADAGTAIGVTVLRSNNMSVMYDDNDFTLINGAGEDVDIGGLVFNAVETTTPASFNATRWENVLSAKNCAQLWSIRRGTPKDTPGCDHIERWLTTNNPAEHFWTQLNGVSSFNLTLDGTEVVTCPAAAPGTEEMICPFFLAVASNIGDVVPYVYMAYTSDRLVIFNQSEDSWMSLDGVRLISHNAINQPQTTLNLDDPSIYGNPQTVANLSFLAPGQCSFFSAGVQPSTNPPQKCDVIVSVHVQTDLFFWSSDFQVVTAYGSIQHTCPAAVPGRLTICVMPR